MAATVAVFLAGLSVYWYYLASPLFPLRAVVKENHYYAREEKITALFTNYLGKDILALDIQSVAQELAGLPWVKSVAVFRKLNGVVQVVLSEYQPGYILKTPQAKRFYISADGYVMEEVHGAMDRKLEYHGIHLPEIFTAESGVAPGDFIWQTPLLYSLAQSVPEDFLLDFSIRLESGGIVLVKGNMEVFLGEDKYPRKADALASVLGQPFSFYLDYRVHIDDNAVYIRESLGN